MNNNQVVDNINKDLAKKLVFCALPAIFWVIFLWNFWDKGPYAMGFNATVFGFGVLAVLTWSLIKNKVYAKNDLIWLIPLGLIFLSYSIYDNSFIKLTSLIFSPLLLSLFYIQAYGSDKNIITWDLGFMASVLARLFSFITKIWQSAKLYLQLIIPLRNKNYIFIRVVGGLFLLLAISFTVFIPLLSSADPDFAGTVLVAYDWFLKTFSSVIVYKVIMASVLSLIFFSVLTAWSHHFEYVHDRANKKIDSIISGIVLGGVLCLYVLFLWVQIKHLWVGSLPFDFKETEGLVKSGFWQLLLLSVINILIYFFIYKKTNDFVQKLLTVFTTASLLLLISAGYRMGLYVTYYGFSYEKFFASYTVIYCAILFVWLVAKLFVKQPVNVLKFVITLFLWMYALVAVFPVEQFIIRNNVALTSIKESRIKLYELTMLSPDVISLVKKYQQQGVLIDANDAKLNAKAVQINQVLSWDKWLEQQQQLINNKRWFEKNLINILSAKN